MQTIHCTWADMHEHGDLWYDHLKLRKRVFVDGSDWDVPNIGGVEWDQYDTPATEYFITHDAGKILASSRALRCDMETPSATYMIRDACAGLLPGIPPEIYQDAPASRDTFEATRFAVNPDISPAAKREAMRENAWALIAGCEALGAASVLALMPPGFVAIFKRSGIPAKRLGPITHNRDGEKFCVIGVDTGFVRQQSRRAA